MTTPSVYYREGGRETFPAVVGPVWCSVSTPSQLLRASAMLCTYHPLISLYSFVIFHMNIIINIIRKLFYLAVLPLYLFRLINYWGSGCFGTCFLSQWKNTLRNTIIHSAFKRDGIPTLWAAFIRAEYQSGPVLFCRGIHDVDGKLKYITNQLHLCGVIDAGFVCIGIADYLY